MCVDADKAGVMVALGSITLALGKRDEHAPAAMLVMDGTEARRLSKALTEAAGFLEHGKRVYRRPAHVRR